MTMSRIVLQLALNPGTPAGEADDRQGYIIVAPLDVDGRLDAAAYRSDPRSCVVDRLVDGEKPVRGQLAHRGRGWFIHYGDATAPQEDEAGFRLGDHRFIVGEYVTFTGPDHVALTYRVCDVKPVKQGLFQRAG